MFVRNTVVPFVVRGLSKLFGLVRYTHDMLCIDSRRIFSAKKSALVSQHDRHKKDFLLRLVLEWLPEIGSPKSTHEATRRRVVEVCQRESSAERWTDIVAHIMCYNVSNPREW